MNFRLQFLIAGLVPSLFAVPVTLMVEPGGVGQTSYSSSNGFAVVETEFGGVIEGDITINVLTDKAQTFYYKGGSELTYSDGSTTYTSFTVPETDSFEFTYTSLAADLTTKPGGGAVDPETCRLLAAEHEILLTSGTIAWKYFFVGALIAEGTEDFAENPSQGEQRGATKVEVELVERGAVLDRYRVVLTHDSTNTEVQTEFPFLTIEETGGFSATGEVSVPSASLIDWTLASGGSVPVDGSDTVGGVPVAILFALGLPAGESTINWVLRPEEQEVDLILPGTGTRADLFLETSSDLKNWSETLLEAGTAGTHTMSLPLGHSFVRLAMPGED